MLDHTYASRAIYECRLNGTPVGETTLNVYLAGYFDAFIDGTCLTHGALPFINGLAVGSSARRSWLLGSR